MNRSPFSFFVFISIAALIITASYLYRYMHYAARDQQDAIIYIDHEIMSLKSLDFPHSGELITLLYDYRQELADCTSKKSSSYKQTGARQDTQKMCNLINVNKKMLRSYMHDLQDYTKMSISPQSALVRFTYDKVVRLTLSLAELEKNRTDGIASDEYMKKVVRMREITKQSIDHSKRVLREYLKNISENDHNKINAERQYLTQKMHHFIILDKIMHA